MKTSVVKTFFVTSFAAFFGILFFILMFHEPPAKGLIFSCKFYYDDEHGYTCNILEQNLRHNMKSYDITFSGSKSFRSNVKYVRFANAELDFIPKQIFKFFKNLERLEIVNSTLESLNEDTLAGGVNLKALHLENNQIKYVSERAFDKLEKLECLSLEGNQIEYLHGRLFVNNLQLKYINFRDNNINIMDENVFEKSSNYQSIDLSGNQCVEKKFTSENLQSLKSDLKLCVDNARNEKILSEFAAKEVSFKKHVENAMAMEEAVDNQKYFMNSLLIESGLTTILFGYVMRSLWVKLLRSSKAKKLTKKE